MTHPDDNAALLKVADEIPGLSPGAGITVTAFLLRIGFLASPPVIGVIADASSIRLGLVLVPIAGMVILLTSGILDTGRATPARSEVEPAGPGVEPTAADGPAPK